MSSISCFSEFRFPGAAFRGLTLADVGCNFGCEPRRFGPCGRPAGGAAADEASVRAGAGHHLVEKLFRDARALNIVEGTGQIQRIIIGRSLVGLPR